MKKSLMIAALALAAVAGSALASSDGKVEVCHEGALITISVHAMPAHLDHGDTPYICE